MRRSSKTEVDDTPADDDEAADDVARFPMSEGDAQLPESMIDDHDDDGEPEDGSS